jgi:phospholipid/cholesterol/gamma-HCH transport system substrate-binding protein
MKFRIRHADKIVGAFVFVALLCVFVLIFMLGVNQRWFQRTYAYKSHFLTANNVSVGTAISMKGFEVGRIAKVVLNDKNAVDVDIYIYEGYQKRITVNTLLDVVTSPIGLGSSLVLYRGLSNERLKEGSDILSTDYPAGKMLMTSGFVDMPPRDDTVTTLIGKVNDILDTSNDNLKVLLDTWNGVNVHGPTGSLGANLGALQNALDMSQVTLGSLNHVMAGVDTEGTKALKSAGTELPKSLEQINTLLASVNTITKDIEGTTSLLRDPTGLAVKLIDPKGSIATLLDDKNQLWARLNKVLDDVQIMTDDLKRTTSGVADEVPKISGLLLETRQTMAKAQDVLEGLRNNPLLSGGVTSKPEPQAAYQSVRQGDF